MQHNAYKDCMVYGVSVVFGDSTFNSWLLKLTQSAN